jgi:hypothetical protein
MKNTKKTLNKFFSFSHNNKSKREIKIKQSKKNEQTLTFKLKIHDIFEKKKN